MAARPTRSEGDLTIEVKHTATGIERPLELPPGITPALIIKPVIADAWPTRSE
jgi:hypothetical protein